MCDIYYHPCKVCGKLIEMHLGGFDTNRFEIEVYCSKHIPKEWVVVWNSKRYGLVGVRPLTRNAWLNVKENYPNDWPVKIIEVRKPIKVVKRAEIRFIIDRLIEKVTGWWYDFLIKLVLE